MEYSFSKKGSTITCEIKLDKADWEKAVAAAYEKTKGDYKIPGFRPGKAPRKVIENAYGPGVFFDEALNIGFSEAYNTFLDKEADILPIDHPEVSVEDFSEGNVKYKAEIAVKPEVKLGKYKGVEVSRTEVEVTTDEVDAEILRAREKLSRTVDITDRAAKEGDETVIDYSGSVDGVKFQGGTAEKQSLKLGSGQFIPGFEEQVAGMNIGEEKDINIKFPDEYHSEELKGKNAVFHVKLHAIKAKELPAFDDDFVKDTSAFNTCDEYRKDVSDRITKNKEKQAENKLESDILDAVSKDIEIDIPKVLIEQQQQYFLQDFSYRLMYQGMKLEDYFKYTGTTEEDFKKEREQDAVKAVRQRLVIEQIIKEEKIEAGEEEIAKKLAETAEAQGKPVEEFKSTVNDRQMGYIRNEVIMDKLMELLKANAVIGGAKKTAKKAKK